MTAKLNCFHTLYVPSCYKVTLGLVLIYNDRCNLIVELSDIYLAWSDIRYISDKQ